MEVGRFFLHRDGILPHTLKNLRDDGMLIEKTDPSNVSLVAISHTDKI